MKSLHYCLLRKYLSTIFAQQEEPLYARSFLHMFSRSTPALRTSSRHFARTFTSPPEARERILNTMQYSVTAVVVSYNREHLLSECLQALDSQTREPDRIVIVDNASTDNALQVAREFATRTAIPAQILALPENTGGAGGFCAGIAQAMQDEVDARKRDQDDAAHRAAYIWLMDDDTIPTPTALEELLRASDACILDNNCLPTILGSKAVWTDGREHLMNKPRPRAALAKGRRDLHGFDGAYQVRSLSFVSCLINAGAILGRRRLPQAAFFLWNDDFEYTTALLRRGIGYYVPQSEVVHKTKKFGSSDADPGARFYNEVRNKIWMLRFHANDFTFVGRLAFLAKTARRWALTVARAHDCALILRCLREGWHDGWHSAPESNLHIFERVCPQLVPVIERLSLE